MDDRIIQFRVGVLVVATCIITAILIVLFGELPTFAHRQYQVHVQFDRAPGVTVDTPVRKSGILIGRVSEVQLKEAGGVLVTLRIDAKRKLRESERCRISTGNVLLGDATIEFVPGGGAAGASTEPITDGQYIHGEVATSPSDVINVLVNVARVVENLEGDISSAAKSVQVAGRQVATVSQNLNTVVENNQSQFLRIMQKSEKAIDQFQITMTAVDGFVGDDELRQALQQSLEQLPDLMTDARQTLGLFDSVAKRFDSVAQRADRNLRSLEGLTAPLGQRGGKLVDSLDQSISQLDTLLAELTKFGQALNTSEGSLGQFVHNPDLYQRLNRAATNMEQITIRFRPIVEDARIFTDKIARNPGALTSGILSPRQSGVKFPRF